MDRIARAMLYTTDRDLKQIEERLREREGRMAGDDRDDDYDDEDEDYDDEDEDEDYDDEDEDEEVLQVAGARRALHTVKATCEGLIVR